METSKLNIGSSRKTITFTIIDKKLPTSDRNTSLHFNNNIKVPQFRTCKFTRIQLNVYMNLTALRDNGR